VRDNPLAAPDFCLEFQAQVPVGGRRFLQPDAHTIKFRAKVTIRGSFLLQFLEGVGQFDAELPVLLGAIAHFRDRLIDADTEGGILSRTMPQVCLQLLGLETRLIAFLLLYNFDRGELLL
jgi:hypothetical protein